MTEKRLQEPGTATTSEMSAPLDWIKSSTTAKFRYDAFISYSHKNKDFAQRLSRRIRRYKPPRASGLAGKRLTVFRDVERLTAETDLSRALTNEVGKSKYLVLLASPYAAASPYVNKEVAAFIDSRGIDHIRTVLYGGEFAAALPPVLQDIEAEPLFIDLRDPSRSRFRLETLRLIASLFEVDYQALRREDDLQRRRRRNLAITTGLTLAAFLASVYLVSITPSEAWQRIRQPFNEIGTEALAPIENVAIHRTNTDIVAWFGRNARHARDLTAKNIVWMAAGALPGFKTRAREWLARDTGSPLATVKLTVKSLGDQTAAKLNMQVYGFLQGDMIRYVRNTIIRPTGGQIGFLDHLSWEPFDINAGWLKEQQLNPFEIIGRIVDHTDGNRLVEVRFENTIGDAEEPLDATSAGEFILFLNDPDLNQKYADQQELHGAEDIWMKMVENSEWITYAPPNIITDGFQPSDSTDEVLDPEAIAELTHRGIDAKLITEMAAALPRSDVYRLKIIERGTISVAIVNPLWDHHEVVQQPPPLFFFGNAKMNSPRFWKRIELPTRRPRTTIVDIFSLDEFGVSALLLTKGEGFFRTLDGGGTWAEANLGQAAFQQASSVKTIVAPGSTIYGLAILETLPGRDVNPLFRLEHRSWFDRWRIGLADLLHEPD